MAAKKKKSVKECGVRNPSHDPRARGRLEGQEGLGLDRHDEAGVYVNKGAQSPQIVRPATMERQEDF
mgnify:CR=1 FL=1